MEIKPLSILLVEDNPGDIRLIQETLAESDEQFNLTHADKLSAAIKQVNSRDIDVVLLDLGLPDSYGKETFSQLKQQAADVPVVVLTGLQDEGLGIELVKDGAQDYLVKGEMSSPLLRRSIRYAVERKRAEEQLRYVLLHDPVTGLYNRIYFEEEMCRIEKGRYESTGIIVCDVDGLKFVNDTLGHNSGDDLLRAAAGIIGGCFRKGDMVARVGGDEFAILLTNGSKATLEMACQRIRKGVMQYNTAIRKLHLSISVGFAVNEGEPPNMKKLFGEADNSMYLDKLRQGPSARSAFVQALMEDLKGKDFIMEGHVERLEKLITRVAMLLGLAEDSLPEVRLLARFHDIGKVGVREHILSKADSLTPEEVGEIRRHCDIGYRIAIATGDLASIADWILKHHEWWDGNGYPLHLRGEEIPLPSRMLAIVDAFDAMTSDRPYRKAMPRKEAVAEILRCSGSQFDPSLVPKFLGTLEN